MRPRLRVATAVATLIVTVFTPSAASAASAGSAAEPDRDRSWASIGTATPYPTYKVTARSGLKLRTGPGTKYRKIGVLRNGTLVKSAGRTAPGWIKVRTPAGHTGWVASRYLVKTSATAPSPPAGAPVQGRLVAYRVTARTSLVLRAGPGRKHRRITSLNGGVVVAGTGRTSGAWAQLRLTDGRTGWSSLRFLTRTALPIYRVKDRAANLRSGPGLDHRRVGVMQAGIAAPGTGQTSRGWVRIHLSDGSTAWIAGGMITRL